MEHGGPPQIALPGCPVNCDTCAFPAIETDLRLFSWVEIEAQMWDTDTKIDAVLTGGFSVWCWRLVALIIGAVAAVDEVFAGCAHPCGVLVGRLVPVHNSLPHEAARL